jgi:2-iminobutanoate/2-iminopropanoate deaminase
LPRKTITSDKAPRPIGPYSQAIAAGGLLFISGQIPIDPATGELIQGDIEAQTEQVMKNLIAILREVKMGPEHVVKTTVFLADLGEFARMNEVYGRYLGKEPPARSTVEVSKLPKGARIEVEAVAAY